MGTNSTLSLTPERALHVDIMRAIARDFADLPMVLKGGTALLLCYGLDRFSEDLDFDAPKKFNIGGRIEKRLAQKTTAYEVRTVKDTETVQRFKAHYTGVSSDRLLKIETSFRSAPSAESVTVIDGIRTYTLPTLIDQKITALAQRTAARDLYDIGFLVRTHGKAFTPELQKRLSAVMADVDEVEQRFKEAFEEDEILDSSILTETILSITNFLHMG